MRDWRIAEVTSEPAMKTRPASSKVIGFWRARRADRLALGQRQTLAHREPRQGAVHRPRVEVAEAEPLRQQAGDGALAGPCGPVDGDDHLCTIWSIRS